MRLFARLGARREHRVALRPLLCGGASDADLEHALRQAIALKPRQHGFGEQPERIVRFMARTGG